MRDTETASAQQPASLPVPALFRLFSALVLCVLLGSPPLLAAEPLRVVVSGIDGEILSNVQAALSIPPGMVREGEVNMLWLERFRSRAEEKVRTALEPFGFYNAVISVELETIDEKSHVLRVNVVPGARVIVAGVDVTLSGPGAKERPLEDLAGAFPLKQGDILRHDVYETAKGALKSRAIGLGYLDADFLVHQVLVSRQESSARIVLTLDTGPRYLFGEVSFEDTKTYPEKFLRRYVAFKPGEVFSHAKLSLTQLNLINSDRFSDIIISPEKEKAEDSQVPVSIRLVPSPPKRLRMGVGYGTDTGARFSLQYKDLNIFRRGHELNAELSLSQLLQAVAAGYIIPGRTIDSFTELKMNFKREDVDTYETRVFSVEANRTRSLGRGRLGTAYVRAQQEDSTVGNQDVSAKLVLLGLQLSEQRYDDIIRPARGRRYRLELRGTDNFLGSDIGLLQVLAEGSVLVPLPWGFSLQSRLQGAVTFERESLGELPASLRFFAGGDRSVRGYAYQSLGPRDAAGIVVGGKNLLAGSIEIERAVRPDLGIALFYDVGNAFNDINDINLFQGAGLGVRYYTRVGAIRLDVARQIGVDNPRFRLHFALGYEL